MSLSGIGYWYRSIYITAAAQNLPHQPGTRTSLKTETISRKRAGLSGAGGHHTLFRGPKHCDSWAVKTRTALTAYSGTGVRKKARSVDKVKDIQTNAFIGNISATTMRNYISQCYTCCKFQRWRSIWGSCISNICAQTQAHTHTYPVYTTLNLSHCYYRSNSPLFSTHDLKSKYNPFCLINASIKSFWVTSNYISFKILRIMCWQRVKC